MRSVLIFGEISLWNEAEIRRSIEAASKADAIKLHVHSPGGFVRSAEAIACDLRATGRPIRAHAYEECSSAAVIPFMAATWRTASVASRFFLHEASLDASNVDLTISNVQKLRRMASDLEWIDRRHGAFLASLKLPPHLEARARSHGLELWGRDAFAYELVHELLP